MDFVGQLFGLAPLEAVRKLNTDFSLELPIDHRPTDADRRAARHRAEIAATRQAFNEWRQETINRLNAAIRVANQADPTEWADLTEQQVIAIQWRDTLENYSDVLTGGSMDEKMEIFRLRKEVRDICNQILRSMRQNSNAA